MRSAHEVTFVPDRCQIEFDRRVLPGERIEDVDREVKDLFAGIRQRNKIEVELVKTPQFKPWQISQQDPVVSLLERACRKILAKRPDFSGLNGYYEVELLAGAGMPSVVFGPGADSAAHAPDEHVAVQQVIDAAGIYALRAYEFISH